MKQRVDPIATSIIRFTFYALLFAVPLIFLPGHVELFQFNKMMTVYLSTIIITTAWFIRMVAQSRFFVRRTPLDLPLLLFLLSQIISTLLSIEPHTSLFGYYSRFHGGLLSTISYILLYYAYVSNMSSFPSYKREEEEQISAGWIGKASSLASQTEEESATKPNRVQPKKFRSPTSPLQLSLIFLILSTTIVSLYGILEHFGIDANYWVQDVRNRVFSTLGQPNWLAALLVMVMPLTLAFALTDLTNKHKEDTSRKKRFLNSKLWTFNFSLCFLTLLYTKSRSGFLGFAVMYVTFWALTFLSLRDQPLKVRSSFLKLSGILIVISLFVGTPFSSNLTQLVQRYTTKTEVQAPTESTNTIIKSEGGTESGDIRKIVWKGALEIWRHYPIFGSGVETFAYSYYNFRPVEHNFVSEWDFLYNKAHNEYLNFLATSGAVGLGTYLFLIASYIFWSIKNILINKSEGSQFSLAATARPKAWLANYYKKLFEIEPPVAKKIPATRAQALAAKRISVTSDKALLISLLSGFLGVLVTNFFGFSTVTDGLLFFLYPAIALSIAQENPRWLTLGKTEKAEKLSGYQWLLLTTLLILSLFLSLKVGVRWYADRIFAKGKALSDANEISQALILMQQATKLVPDEPTFRDRLALDLARSASALFQDKEATTAAQFAQLSQIHSDIVILQNSVHLNFLKNRAATMLHLASIEPKYRELAISALQRAEELAPTDPKLPYNLGLLYTQNDHQEKAIAALQKSVNLKPDYEPARLALASTFEKSGQLEDAIAQYQAILKYFPANPAALAALERLATASGKRQ